MIPCHHIFLSLLRLCCNGYVVRSLSVVTSLIPWMWTLSTQFYNMRTTRFCLSKERFSKFRLLRGFLMLFLPTQGSKSTSVKALWSQLTCQEIAEMLGCTVSSFPCTYLGLPLSTHKITHAMLIPVIHRVDKWLSGWLAAFLSWGGRLTLINAVLSAIPSYFTACFL